MIKWVNSIEENHYGIFRPEEEVPVQFVAEHVSRFFTTSYVQMELRKRYVSSAKIRKSNFKIIKLKVSDADFFFYLLMLLT